MYYKINYQRRFSKNNFFKFGLTQGRHPIQKNYSSFAAWCHPKGKRGDSFYNFYKFSGYQYIKCRPERGIKHGL